MRTGVASGRWAIVLIATLLMLLAGPAASASGAASVRFVQAVPGAGAFFQLHATEGGITQRVGRPTGFGEVGGYADVPVGRVTFELRGRGDRRLADVTARLRNGQRYTVVALGPGADRLRVLEDGGARGGTSRLRVVNAAPELGNVDVSLGDRRVASSIAFPDVAPYTTVEPGAYALTVSRPDDGSPLAARGAVPLTAGTSSTAFVVGTAGEPLRVVVASDRAAAPRGAPATGLGGLSGEGSRLGLALLAALLAAAAGAASYMALTARSRRGGP
jgi:hypothetical protein